MKQYLNIEQLKELNNQAHNQIERKEHENEVEGDEFQGHIANINQTEFNKILFILSEGGNNQK